MTTMAITRQKLWTKNFLIVSVENFFAYLAYYLLIATIAEYTTVEFHASPSLAGLSAGIFILGMLFGRLFSGKSIDHVGRKKMLWIGFIFYIITTLLYFIANNILLLIIVRVLNGAAFGVASTSTGTIVAEIIPKERSGEGIGYYALSTTIAAAIGPFLGLFLLNHGGFTQDFIVCAFVLVISLLANFLLKVDDPDFSQNDVVEEKGIKFSQFFESKAIPISIVSLFIGLSYSSILSFLTSYSEELNLVSVASFFFIAYAAAILVSRPFVGKLFDLKGENSVIYATFILFAIGLFVLSEVHHGFLLLLSGVIVGLGYGNFLSSAQAIAIKVSPRDRMGLATSTFFMFTDLGAGIGPFVLGFFIPTLGFQGLYFGMAIVVIACIVLYFFLHGRKARHLAA